MSKQLKLILFPKDKRPYGLPEGYTVTKYSGSEQEQLDWVAICKNGLLPDDAGQEAFDEKMLNRNNINPFDDIFFIEHEGRRIATVTAISSYNAPGMGYIHMVSAATQARGLGLGHCLNRIAETHLWQKGNPIAYLTTDDWRKAACKSYLAAGFYPVNWDTDMAERWTALITEFGIGSVMMLKENGEPDRMLFARK